MGLAVSCSHHLHWQNIRFYYIYVLTNFHYNHFKALLLTKLYQLDPDKFEYNILFLKKAFNSGEVRGPIFEQRTLLDSRLTKVSSSMEIRNKS